MPTTTKSSEPMMTLPAAPPRLFGKQVRACREQFGLTREQLAHKVGCSAVTIYKIEIGERRPSVQIARLLAKHLEIAPDQVEVFVCAARGVDGQALHTPS
jgi:transcriptional regulator with XRE-family HTH domain